MRRFVTALIALLVCGLAVVWWTGHRRGFFPPFPPPEVVRSVGSQAQWHAEALRRHFWSLTPDDGGIRIEQDGWFHMPPNPLRVGDGFQGPPDHHAASRYTILGIETDGVQIEYESTFNHHSFGRNLVTVDTGRITLPFTAETKAAHPAKEPDGLP